MTTSATHRIVIYREPAPDGSWGAFCHTCGFDHSGYGSRIVAVQVAAEHEEATKDSPLPSEYGR